MVVSVNYYWVVMRDQNQEGIRPDNFLINGLKTAFSVVEQEWGVGQKLDGEGW